MGGIQLVCDGEIFILVMLINCLFERQLVMHYYR